MTDVRSKTVCPGRWELYSNVRVVQSGLLPLQSQIWPTLDDLTSCTGVKRQYLTVTDSMLKPGTYAEGVTIPHVPFKHAVELIPASAWGISSSPGSTKIPLHRWTILRQLVLNPRTALNGLPTLKGTATGMYIAVLPSSEPAVAEEFNAVGRVDAKGNVSLLSYGRAPLPQAPQLDSTGNQFSAK